MQSLLFLYSLKRPKTELGEYENHLIMTTKSYWNTLNPTIATKSKTVILKYVMLNVVMPLTLTLLESLALVEYACQIWSPSITYVSKAFAKVKVVVSLLPTESHKQAKN